MANDMTKLLKKLFPESDSDGPGSLTLRTMTVSAVNGDGTVDLSSSGVVIPDVNRLESATVSNGDRVQVLASRGQLLVLGTVATS
jgi:hypothetical protein